MALTRSQKKYLRKNLKRFSLAKIGADLGISEKEILDFLKSHWRKEKYEKFLSQHSQGVPQAQHHLGGEPWKIFAFLAFLVFAVYFNSLANDFVSDDISAIKENPGINHPSLFWQPPYFNLSLRAVIIFFVNKIFGLRPAFYRLINIGFHLGSVWLVYLLVSFFFPSTVSLFTASLFATHPILTEAVAWISGGPYSSSSFFILLSFLAYLKFHLVSVIPFYLALLCSEKVVVFPLALLLYELCFGNLRTNWPKLVPFGLISGFWALHLIGLIGLRTTALETVHYQEPGLHNPLIQIPIAITSYLELIFWPKNLTLNHSEMTFSQTEYFLRLGVFILFLATIVYFFKKDRRIFFWLLFFLITLLPTLTPLRIAWVVAERYVSLGSLGIFLLIALAIQKIGEVSKNQKVAYVILAIILAALATRTIIRNADWKNQDALWLATAKTSPSSPQNHNNLGDYYFRQGDLEKAAEEFKRAIELKPNYGDAYHNLANTYHQMEKDDLAIENYQKALSFKPNLWQSHLNLAVIYFDRGQFDLSRKGLEKTIEINPEDVNLHISLGIVYLKLNEKERAKNEFQTTLQLDPNNQRAQEGLIKALQ